MTKTLVMQQLYMRENEPFELVEQNQVASTPPDENYFAKWQETKRALVMADVVDTHWIKTCTAGYVTEVIFHQDGTLHEYRLFDRFETCGVWQLVQGILNVSIYKGDNHYQFAVVGNSKVNIHSAIEYKNGELHSYLKLGQVK
ncbi:hypothetical protein [Vibrio sp. SCSIO 43136]|uniref:hypothetical protein n=1 Tax=Vibrio sp. SCSIO 43136 TaxID=2819101 RepID=UPI002075C470|nr:hypothetical protein [Vibrio sp. SCSIO 43136]USD67563.1 hypothetical protein J4N39_15300 [Vibrio sp. SCSIO 43136]